MKTLLIAGLVLLVLVDIWLVNLAFSMVSQASTAAVFGGIGLLIAIVGITGLAFGYTGRLFPPPQPRWRHNEQHRFGRQPQQPPLYPAGTAYLRLIWADDANDRLTLWYRTAITMDGVTYDSVGACLQALAGTMPIHDGLDTGTAANGPTTPSTARIALLVDALRNRLRQDSLFAAELHALSALGSYRVMYVDDDAFWGCTADGRGANVYGQVLQDLAQEYAQRRS